jgi:hypothetical protein
MAELTNAVRRKCRFNYIFSVQANEIVHERSAELIRALPEMCPEVRTFNFPYLHLMWSYRISQEFKSSFSRNLAGVVSIGDAWSLGPSRAFVVSEAFKSLKNPRRFLSVYVGRGSLVYSANRFSKPIYLPQPIFRYWSLFPRNYLTKCAKHAEMFNLKQFNEHVKILEKYVDDPPSFWLMALKIAKAGVFSAGINYPEALGLVKKEEHPKLVQGLISTSNSRYYVREEILDAIREL